MPHLRCATAAAAAAVICLAGMPVFVSAQAPGATQGPAWSPALDWRALRAEALEHFRALVRIDSANPPGNERRVVEYLARVLEAEGIPTRQFALDPNRPNLVARLKGSGARRPLLLLAHTDTVGVQREKWPVDPFGAVMQDGYVWGRGTTDDKDKLAAMLMVMLVARRTAMPLDRDLIFLAESAEEADATGVGIQFMVTQHFDAIDAEFAITEGPGATIEGSRTLVQLTTSEKVPRRVRLVATGTSGHGSVPRLDNPVTHLAAAVAKVGTLQMPARLNATTRRYFETLASVSAPDVASRYRAVLSGAGSGEAEQYLAREEPEHNSILRTSLVPTLLQAGIGPNVIPSSAEATIDIRALPDEDIPALLARLRQLIDDPAVEVVPLPAVRPATTPSSIDSDMYRALERAARRHFPNAVVLPSMLPAATDMAQLRAKGVQAYGIGPALTPDDRLRHSWHSDVERIPEASFYQFVEFVWTAVADVAARR